MHIDQRNYTIIWDEPPTSGLRTTTRRRLPHLLPYLVTNAERERSQAETAVVLDLDMLTRGLLHCGLLQGRLAPQQSAGSGNSSAWRLTLRYLLEDLREHSGFESLELMVLVHAVRVREAHGHLPAMKMLMTGHHLLPRSSEIRSDLILDLWALVESVDAIDRDSAFSLIRGLYDGIRFQHLKEDVVDQLDYANFVALSHLGDHQRRNVLFWRVIAKRVRHQGLKHRMIKLLNRRCAPQAAVAANLRVAQVLHQS